MVIDNVDWEREGDTTLSFTRTLPNDIRFGSRIDLADDGADITLWLENNTDAALTGLRTQVCAMLKGVPGFTRQSQDEKRYGTSVAVAKAEDADRYILVAFEECGRTWGNDACPCIHADPVFPDASPGERVQVRGKLWFHEGGDIDAAISRAETRFTK